MKYYLLEVGTQNRCSLEQQSTTIGTDTVLAKLVPGFWGLIVESDAVKIEGKPINKLEPRMFEVGETIEVNGVTYQFCEES